MSRTSLIKKLNVGALTAALLVSAAGMAAHAAQPEDKELQGSFKEPLNEGKSEGGNFSSKTVITSTEDDGTYKIEITDGKIKAWHNDKALPKDRVRKSKEKVEILDKEGNVLHTFQLGAGFGATGIPGMGGQDGRFFLRVPGGQGGAQGGGKGGQGGAWMGEPPQVAIQNAPPVMIGITMNDADEEALDDTDFESGILVDRVVEGLPADKAGLKVHDVIVEVEGAKPIDQEKFRQILRDHKAGDEISMKVLRDGKVSERRLKLEKFDANKLGMAEQRIEVGPEGEQFEMHNLPDVLKMYGEGGKAQWDEARKAIEQALKELQENENLKPEKIRGQAEKALEQAMKALKEAEAQGGAQWRRFMDGGEGQGAPRTWMWSDRPGQLYTVPTPPPRADGDTSRKLDRLGEQLERLNKRLDELERRLDSSPRERNP